jgi:hypothetical protein
MRLQHTLAAVLLGFAATLAATGPAAAATPVCSFAADPGAGVSPAARSDSPTIFTAAVLFGVRASCSPFPAKMHTVTTVHLTLNGVAQPDYTYTRDCTNPDPIAACPPLSVEAVLGLRCDTVYSWTTILSHSGWYQETTGGPQITIVPVTGTPRTGILQKATGCN